MPQIQLPMFPQGVTHITSELAFETRDGRVTYFNGSMPVFTHDEKDVQTFRVITSQFCINGNATQPDIVKAFGVPLSTIKRYCRLYREKGPAGFYAPKPHRGAAVLTKPVLQQAQDLLDEGYPESVVAQRLGIKANTFAKAVRAGRVHVAGKKKPRM
jgi:transposase